MLQGRNNGKLPEWELHFIPHDLPVVITKRENRVYPDEVKRAPGSVRLSSPRRDFHISGGRGLDRRFQGMGGKAPWHDPSLLDHAM